MKTEKEYLNKDLVLNENDFCESITNDFIGSDFIDNLEWAMLIIQSNFKQIKFAEYLPNITRNHFDKSFLITESIKEMHSTLAFIKPFTGCNATPEIFPNLNIKYLNINETITLKKVKEIEQKEKLKLKVKNKYAFEISEAFYKKDTESFYGEKCGFGINPSFFEFGTKEKIEINDLPCPFSLHPDYSMPKNAILYLSKETISQIIIDIQIAYQLALTMYYEWCIYIKEYNNIGLIIPIEPHILSEIYKTSMLNFDNKKKMLHFVKEHYRRKIANPNEDYSIFIKKYIRGEYKFNYKNFYTEIIPPKYDLNRIKTRKKFIDSLL
jgi:hypothetical protein